MIEWNRVTWYSKLLAVIVFVGVFCIAFHLGEEFAFIKFQNINSYSPDVFVSKTNEVTLGLGQTGRVGKLDITFNKFIADSRCPVDVQCIQAGAVHISVTLKSDDYAEIIDMPSAEVPHTFGEFKVSFTNVVPPRHSKTEIEPSDYKITFHVESNAPVI